MRYLGLIVLFAVSASAKPPALERFEFAERHMGTRFRIILYAPDAGAAERAAKAAFQRVAALDSIMSDYRADSELSRLSDQAGGQTVKVSEDLFRVLAAAQKLAQETRGAFDVTAGPVVQLWRIARMKGSLPDPELMEQARARVGYENLSLNDREQTAQLLKKDMSLDLGGIAKGFAADEALRVLKQFQIQSALVAAGGDIAVSDAPSGKSGWLIGIAPLEPPGSKPKRFLLLSNAAVSTSGDAEQHVEINGVRYSHIVDPRTGEALEGRSSVSVVAPNGMTSDSLATAISVLGPVKGLELIRRTKETGVLMVFETTQGRKEVKLNFPPEAKPDDN